MPMFNVSHHDAAARLVNMFHNQEISAGDATSMSVAFIMLFSIDDPDGFDMGQFLATAAGIQKVEINDLNNGTKLMNQLRDDIVANGYRVEG